MVAVTAAKEAAAAPAAEAAATEATVVILVAIVTVTVATVATEAVPEELRFPLLFQHLVIQIKNKSIKINRSVVVHNAMFGHLSHWYASPLTDCIISILNWR